MSLLHCNSVSSSFANIEAESNMLLWSFAGGAGLAKPYTGERLSGSATKMKLSLHLHFLGLRLMFIFRDCDNLRLINERLRGFVDISLVKGDN